MDNLPDEEMKNLLVQIQQLKHKFHRSLSENATFAESKTIYLQIKAAEQRLQSNVAMPHESHIHDGASRRNK